MKKYFSLVKFSHSVFALPFALIGFFLAIRVQHFEFSYVTFLIMLACMLIARTAAMAFNRWADRTIDANNFRTSKREIPSGVISQNAALLLVLFCVFAFVIFTAFINDLAFYLSPVALFVILGYSYTKRFTSLSHWFLGLSLSFAPIGAYICVASSFDLLPIILGAAVLTWVAGFDIIYSLQDEEFDKQNNLHSIPQWLGKKNALRVSVVCHLFTVIFLGWFAYEGNFLNLWFITGFIFFTAMLFYQHTLVKANDLSKLNAAFFTTNGIASIVFAVFTLLSFYFYN